ncbi:ribonuclease J 2 [Clostridium sp. CAG:710]|nr:ribonuclease J 2 [Clostridium sp. CAG:710]
MSKIKIFSLGGLNENGKNMYVVDVDDNIFIFDAGLKYGNDKMLGIDYILPDYTYIKENKDKIKGIFLTHGHDSNMGATADILYDMPDLPIYATKYTMEILKIDLEENNIKATNLKEIRPHSKLTFGDLAVFPISVTHSIPDAVCYVLYTKDGAIVYTGDFVFDSTMMKNYKTDIGKLAYVGKQGVLCLLSESIYAEKPGHTSPNNRVSDFVADVFAKTSDRIIATIMTAHIYRVQEIFNEVMETKRKVVIMGKSLQHLINRSIDLGYIDFDKDRIGDLSNLNDKGVVVLISDEKEKPFMNLERIIRGFDKYIKLKDTDTIFITEPSYEGIERRLALIMDEIAMANVNVVCLSSKKHLLHHASREDLMLMINLMNPKYYFPVKGEYRHQVMNAEIAEEVGIPKENIILKQNGDVATFVDGNLTDDIEHVNVDEILIDGKSQGDIGDLVLKDREMLGENGIVIISATLDKATKQILAGPEVLTRGFVYVKESGDLIKETQDICLEILKNNIEISSSRVDYTTIKNEVREKLGKFYYKETESKPMIITVIQEV